MNDGDRSSHERFGQVSFVFRLEIVPPFNRKFESFAGVLKELNSLGVRDDLKRLLVSLFEDFRQGGLDEADLVVLARP